MVPSLLPGDMVLVSRSAPIEVGDVVVARHPTGVDGLWIKRVNRTDGTHVDLEGDNPLESTDSRQLGPVALSEVLGRVTSRIRR